MLEKTFHVNNKGRNQTVLLHSLISAYVIHCLGRILVKLATCKISIFYLGSVAELVNWALPGRKAQLQGQYVLRS